MKQTNGSVEPDFSESVQKCCNCETCIPIGKRKGNCAIHDGRFDTKEQCCKTRRCGKECPRVLACVRKWKQEQHDNQVRKDERKVILEEIGLNCFGEYQMNNRRCMTCQVGDRCYDKRESLRNIKEKKENDMAEMDSTQCTARMQEYEKIGDFDHPHCEMGGMALHRCSALIKRKECPKGIQKI